MDNMDVVAFLNAINNLAQLDQADRAHGRRVEFERVALATLSEAVVKITEVTAKAVTELDQQRLEALGDAYPQHTQAMAASQAAAWEAAGDRMMDIGEKLINLRMAELQLRMTEAELQLRMTEAAQIPDEE